MAGCCIVLLAILIDATIGEVPNAIHPLRWVGNTVAWLDRRFKRKSSRGTKIKGFFGFLIVFLLFGGISFLITSLVKYYLGEIAWIIVTAFLFKTCFAIFSFRKHCKPIQKDLKNGDLEKAAEKTQMIVSRNTKNMDAEHIASSCTETTSENLADSIISPTFYFGLFGLVGAILFRCSNLMDAMWGYINEKYKDLGFFVAKLDDVLGFITSRMSIIFVIISAIIMRLEWKSIIRECKLGKNLTPSPNSSWPMVACATALGISMEKKDVYVMGKGNLPTVEDISRCYHLVELTAIIFILLVTLPLYSFIGIEIQILIENTIIKIGGLIL